MKNITILLVAWSLFFSVGLYAQEPNLANVSFSTKDGTFKDPRDGKIYSYKKYGESDWFMHNLNWDGYDGKDELTKGTVGKWGSADADGSKFGRFYLTGSPDACPDGWRSAGSGPWGQLIKDISAEYQAPDLVDPTGNGYTFKEALKYLRGGSIQGVKDDGLWDATTGTVDAKADLIQFNLLPMGELTADGTGYVTGNEVGKRIWLKSSNNDRFQNNPNNDANGLNALRHQSKNNAYAAVRCVRLSVPDVPIITPYPTVFEIKQINSAGKEVNRTKARMKQFDHVLTAYYLEKGKKLNIKVETLVAAQDGAIPQVVIGTYAQRNPEDMTKSQSVVTLNLKEGQNIIDASMHTGGLIYLRYVSDADSNTPTGKVKITLDENGDQKRAPHHVYGVTGDEEFKVMLDQYRVPEVMLSSDEILAVTSREAAQDYSVATDKKVWMEQLHKLVALESELSGLNNSDPNPMHHRFKPGEMRFLLTHAASGASPNAADWRTTYPGASRYLTMIKTPTNGAANVVWQMAHEIGHQHQQLAYLIPQSGESTVNIYSIVATRYFNNNPSYFRTPQKKLDENMSKYLALPDDQRYYEMPEIETVTGINRDETRLVPWELMFYIFGDEFYKTLHRVTREEDKVKQSDDDAKYYLITRASLVSGYDLRKYYHAWGIRVKNEYYQDKIDKEITAANLQEPPRIDELHLVSGEKFFNGEYEGWLPLKLKGITTSKPDESNNPPADRLASKDKYCDYTSAKGVLDDSRDRKHYPYKTYGDKDWFITNLDWTGYNGTDASTEGTVGLYGSVDPTGVVYGRMYGTNLGSVANTFCPEGWTYASSGDFISLIERVQADFSLTSTVDAVKCLKCGGDRDDVTDGLWARGGGKIDTEKANLLGFNMLPAGVFNFDAKKYDDGDGEGNKASFITDGWYHNVFSAHDNDRTFPNRNFRHHASVRCVRPAADKIDQAITFDTPAGKVLGDQDFTLTAVTSSKLALEFASSNQAVATVDKATGLVRILSVGETEITVSQAGNNEFAPAPALARKLVVTGGSVTIDKATIDGEEIVLNESNKGQYIVPCGKETSDLKVELPIGAGIEVNLGNPFYVNLKDVAAKNVEFILSNSSGLSKTYSINFVKQPKLEDMTIVKWGNTYIVDKTAIANEQTLTDYKWYKDNVQVGSKQYYQMKGSEASSYMVALTTSDGNVIKSCPSSITPRNISLKAYPNPVTAGQTLYLEAEGMPQEFFNSSTLNVYNSSGVMVKKQAVTDVTSSITMPSASGVYILKVVSEIYESEFKIIVK